MAEKIANEKEAYNKGKKGIPVNNKGCTKARAIALGCNPAPLNSFSDKQLVRTNALAALYDGPPTIWGVNEFIFKLNQHTIYTYIPTYSGVFKNNTDAYINRVDKKVEISYPEGTKEEDVSRLTGPGGYLGNTGDPNRFNEYNQSGNVYYVVAASGPNIFVNRLDDSPENIPSGYMSFYIHHSFTHTNPSLPASDSLWTMNGTNDQHNFVIEHVSYVDINPNEKQFTGFGYMAIAELYLNQNTSDECVAIVPVDVVGTVKYDIVNRTHVYDMNYYISGIYETGFLSKTGNDAISTDINFENDVYLISRYNWADMDLSNIAF